MFTYMKDRIIQFLKEMNLTSTKFADVIGVQRSSISHILSGRNKPSFDFIEKMLVAYPEVNAQWLITGKGNIFENQPSLFNQETDAAENTSTQRESNIQKTSMQEHLISKSDEISLENTEKVNYPTEKHKNIDRVMIFFNDGTFKEYKSE